MFLQDTRYALRLLLKQPGMTTIAVLTLALGIGANTALFSAVDAVLLRTLPYHDPDRLVAVWEKRAAEGVFDNSVSPADFVDWQAMNSVFETMAAHTTSYGDLTGAGEPVRLTVGAVSPTLFDVLRVAPLLGRPFRAEDGIEGRHRVLVLGYAVWQNRFASNRDVVGKTISLNGYPHEIVGVLPPTFEFPGAPVDVWTPLAFERPRQPLSRTLHALNVYARLKPGASLTQARADMDRVGSLLQQQYPDANRNHGAHVVPLRDELSKPVRSGLLLLFGAVAFVLLIACVNVANLLLAKAATRRREMAVRAALGAARGRLVRQALTESVVLSLLGGAAALLVAGWGIDLLRTLAPAGLPVVGVDRLGLDRRILGFTFALSVGTGLLFGLLPAWQLAGQDANEGLKDGGRTTSGVRRRLRVALVVSEIGLASLLLVGTGLTLRSFQALLQSEAGFSTDQRLIATVSFSSAKYSAHAQRENAMAEIQARFASVSGIRAAAAVNHLPLSGEDSRGGIVVEGREPLANSPTRAHLRTVTPDYFRAMAISLQSGRSFTAADRGDSLPVAIVNETFARAYSPGASVIGKRVRLTRDETWREIVGVVGDVRHWGLDVDVKPEVYMPYSQLPLWSAMHFVLLTDTNPASYAVAIREQLRAIDRDLPLSNVRTMEQVAASSMASRRSAMILLALFGGLALALSAAGIYGVMSHLVAQRRAEIGVRMTLGATPSEIMRGILRESALQAFAGLTLGIAAGTAVMRTFGAMLYGVSPTDPVTIAAVVAALLTTALAAALIPARRAMRVDPVQALRN